MDEAKTAMDIAALAAAIISDDTMKFAELQLLGHTRHMPALIWNARVNGLALIGAAYPMHDFDDEFDGASGDYVSRVVVTYIGAGAIYKLRTLSQEEVFEAAPDFFTAVLPIIEQWPTSRFRVCPAPTAPHTADAADTMAAIVREIAGACGWAVNAAMLDNVMRYMRGAVAGRAHGSMLLIPQTVEPPPAPGGDVRSRAEKEGMPF